MAKMNEWKHILNALESAEAEFEELMDEREWYVTDVVDILASAKQIVLEEIKRL